MARLVHPYEQLTGGRWLRGNLHTHTTASDGKRPMQQVLDDYAGRGYGFLMISDHDIFTSAEDYAAVDHRGMILIPGNEVSAQGPHLLHVNADRRIEPNPDRQAVLNAITESGSGFAIINHPNWQDRFNHCSIEQLESWTNYVGLEIYNGTIGRLDGSPYATNKWDMLLSQGRRLWGYAHDDSHLPVEDVGLGWNVAYVRDETPADVAEALARGRFYASTGLTIDCIEVQGLRIRVRAPGAQRIVALHQVGRRFAQVDGDELVAEAPANATYVRLECWGPGESFAWTQPFFVET